MLVILIKTYKLMIISFLTFNHRPYYLPLLLMLAFINSSNIIA
jgi:hypothetical protein